MTRFLLNTLSCILLFVEFLLGICFIIAIVKAAKGEPNSLAPIAVLIVIMVPIAFAIRFLSKKLKKDEQAKEGAADRRRALEYYGLDANLKPEFEIKYKSFDGEITVRKIAVISLSGSELKCFCFLRDDEREFVIPSIQECIDLSTGELITENLMVFFLKRCFPRKKVSNIFEYEEWCETPYVDIPDDLPENLLHFNIDKKLHAKIATYGKGVLEDDFYFGKIYDSEFCADQYYVQIVDSSGNKLNVGFSKILSVDGGNFLDFVIAELSRRKT